MKESKLGSKLKGWAGDPEGASPDGRWPVALLLTQPKQSQNPALVTPQMQPWTRSSQWHSLSYGQEARNMHLGTI